MASLTANGDELAFTFRGTAELSFTDPTDATVTFEAVQDLSGEPADCIAAHMHSRTDRG